jgi:probable F420-dependent oxidoreductase
MRFGLYGLNQNHLCEPGAARRVAVAAEAAGFESLWVGEHVVLPDPLVPPPYMACTDPILDPLLSLAFLAAHTTTIALGTGVLVLPQRNPLVLAKELASLDVLSKGRIIVGIGVGYLEPEMRAVGVPMEHRGSRADEYLRAMIALWTQDKPQFQGHYLNFRDIQAYPRPVQQPYPPIVVAGRSAAAHRRAARFGHGWYGFNLSLDETADQLRGIRQALSHWNRASDLGELEISITPRDSVDVHQVRAYSTLGVHRLILKLPLATKVEQTLAFLSSGAETLIEHTC